MATTAPGLKELEAEMRLRGMKMDAGASSPAPVTTPVPSDAAPDFGALEAEMKRRGLLATPRPTAPSTTPVLPPAGGETFPAAPPPVERLAPATRYTLTPPKAAPALQVPQNVAPRRYNKPQSEMDYFQLAEDRKRLPAAVTQPGHLPGIPMQERDARQTFALAKWYHQDRPKAIQELNDEAEALAADRRKIEVLQAAGKPVPKNLLVAHESRRLGIERRNQEIEGLSNTFNRQRAGGRAQSPQPIHGGMYYPEEVAAGEGQPGKLTGLLSHVSGAAAGMMQVPQVRAALQWEGKYPPLPSIPYKDRARGIAEAAAVRDVIRVIGPRMRPDGSIMSLPYGPLAQRPPQGGKFGVAIAAYKRFTPFQREQLLPVMLQQAKAEDEVNDLLKLGQALKIDIMSQAAAEGVGGVLGNLLRGPAKEAVKRYAPKLFVKYMAETAPRMAAEGAPLSPLAIKQMALRAAPEVAVHTATGGATGYTAGATGTLISGGTLAEAHEQGVRGAKLGAGIGGGTAALSSVLSGTLRSGWNPKTTPNLIEGLLDDARARGVPEEAIPGLRDRMTRVAKAPAAAKGPLLRGIVEEVNSYRAPTKGTGAPRPPVQAEVIPPEQPPAATPRKGKGPVVTSTQGQEIALRETPRETLAQVAQSEGPRAAAAAQHWLDQAEAHDVQMDVRIPDDDAARDLAARAWLKSEARGWHTALNEAATVLARTNPELALRLQQAGAEAHRNFLYSHVRKTAPELAVEPTVPPPTVSLWRQLTPVEQAALPEGARRALLALDLSNSLTTIEPTREPVQRLGDEGSYRSTKALQEAADQTFETAQTVAARRFMAPKVQLEAKSEIAAPGISETASNEIAPLTEAPQAQTGAGIAPEIAPQSNGAQTEAVPAQEPATLQETPVTPAQEAVAPMTAETPVAPVEAALPADLGKTGAARTQKAGTALAEGVKAGAAKRQAKQPLPQKLVDLLDQAHGHVVRQRDVSTLRPAELRAYLDRIEAVLAEATKPETQAEREARGGEVRYSGNPERAQGYLDKARAALDRGDHAQVLLAGEQALQTLHPVGYTPKESPLAAIAPKTGGADYTGPERRANVEQRKRVAEMSPEEKTAEIERLRGIAYNDKMTGVPTRAAYEEADKRAHTAVIDGDSLKWWNDEFKDEAGYAGGDALLGNVGRALREAGLEVYRTGGDEFTAQADTPEELQQKVAFANDYLKRSTVEFKTLDGRTIRRKGAEITWGIAPTLEGETPNAAAAAELGKAKEAREAAGTRTTGGKRPPGVVEVPEEGGAPEGEQGLARDTAEPGRGGGAQEEARVDVAPRAEGADTTFKAGEEEHTARWAIYEAADLVTSHSNDLRENASYPGELQPRDRTRQASREQIAEMAQKLDPRLMGENPLAQHGAPIVGADAAVESGNARTISLRAAYEEGGEAATRYRAWLAKNVGPLGFNAADLKGIKQPVLVRVRTSELTPEQRVQFTRTANARETAAMGATEQAQVDAERLTPKLMNLFDVGESGEISAATNRAFVREFIGSLPTAEQGAMRTAEGTVSQEGMRRIRNAVFFHAYGDAEALTRLAESMDDPARNITNGMLRAAGPIADIRARIAAETVYPVDIVPELLVAARKLAHLRDIGQSVSGFLAQQPLFDEGALSPLERSVLVHLDTNKRSAKRIAATLADYADLASKAGNPSSGILFEDIAPPEKQDLWQLALDRNERMARSDPGLFAETGEAEAQPQRAEVVRPANRPTAGTKTPARPRAAEVSTKAEAAAETVAPKPAAKPRAAKKATGEAGVKLQATDNSVRDLPQRATIVGDTIRVSSYVGRQKAGEYTIPLVEWHKTAGLPTANADYNRAELIRKYTPDLDEEGGNPDRIRDSQIRAIRKALASDVGQKGGEVRQQPVTADTVLYHGTRQQFEGVPKPSLAQQWGKAVYLATDPRVPREEFGNEGGRVLEFTGDFKKPLYVPSPEYDRLVQKLEDESEAERQRLMDAADTGDPAAERAFDKFRSFDSSEPEGGAAIAERARKLGHDAIIAEHDEFGHEVAVLDPSTLRPVKRQAPQEQQRAGNVRRRKFERPDWAEEFEEVGGKIDADGTVLLYHATTKEKGAQIVREGVLRRPADAPDAYGVYLSSSPKVAGSYGDGTVVPVRVRVEDVALDDAFPGERVDFSAPTKTGVYRPVAVGDAALREQGNKGGERRSLPQEQQRAGKKPPTSIANYDGPSNPNFRDYTQENRAVSTRESLATRMKRDLADVIHWGTREFPALPKEGWSAVLHEKMRAVRPGSGQRRAADEAVFNLQETLDGLKGKQLEVFSDLMVARDMLRDVERQRVKWEESGKKGTFEPIIPVEGITEPELRAQRDELETLAQSDTKLAEALDQMVEVRRRVTDPHVELVRDVMGREITLEPETYLRHKVIAYQAAARELRRNGSKFARLLNPSYLRARKGTRLAYDTDFATAEMDWMPDMLLDNKLLELYQYVRDTFDVTPELSRRALAINDEQFEPYLDHLAATAGKTGPAHQAPLRARETSAAATRLGRYAAEGKLPDTQNGRWRPLLDELAGNHQMNEMREAQGLPGRVNLHSDALAQLGDYANWLRDQGVAPGTPRTRQTAATRAAVRKAAGKEFVDVKDLVPEGHRPWVAVPGSVLHRVETMPAQLIEAMQAGDADQIGMALRSMHEGKGVRRPLILRNEVADALDDLMAPRPRSKDAVIVRGWDALQGKLKGAKLTFPPSAVDYFVHNFASDFDRTLRAGGIRTVAGTTVKAVQRGVYEVARTMMGGKLPTPDLREYFRLGGRANLQTQAEGLGGGVDLLGRYSLRAKPILEKLWNVGGNIRNMPHETRETAGRYSLYLYLRDDILKHGKVRTHGASLPDVIDELLEKEGPEAAAFRMAQEWVIDYDETTAGGQFVAKHIYPFWRYQEGSVRYEARLLMNAARSPNAAVRAARKLGVQGPATFLWQIGRLVLLGHALAWTAKLANDYFFGEDEEKLDERTRNRPHLTFRNPISGNIETFNRFSSQSDVLGWFDLDNIGGYAEAVNRGLMTWEEAPREMMMAAANRFLTGTAPQFQLLTKLGGINTYPDVFQPRKGRDPWEAFFADVNLDAAYRWARKVPQKPNTATRMFFGTRLQDFNENAYFETRSYARDWLAKRGRPGDFFGGESTPKTSAAYWFHQAVRMGDEPGQRFYLGLYAKEGGDDNGLQRAKLSMEPLGRMQPVDREEFLSKLAPADQVRLRMSYYHWASLAAPEADLAGLEDMDLNDFVAEVRDVVRDEIKAQTPVEDLMLIDPELVDAEEAREDRKLENKLLRKAGY